MELKPIAHLSRFKEIASILFKYGFDDVIERLGIPGKDLLQRVHPVEREMTTGERIRRSLEELGPTFIKLGQVLSLRPDLLPMELITELEKLQDEVAPVPFSEIKAIVEQSLGKEVSAVFSQFHEEPLAAASLAQVHRAELRDTQLMVAVKVQRPRIRKTVERDLSILERIAGYLQGRLELARIYDFEGLVQEFRKSLMLELDFTFEARNMRIIQRNFADNPFVHIPTVYDEYSTEMLLTMELIQGIKLKDLPEHQHDDRKLLAQRGIAATIKQILEDGFFHADPHPGNIMVMENNVLCFLDWGMVGRLTRESRYRLVDLLEAVADRESEMIIDALLGFIGDHQPYLDERSLERDISYLLDYYHDVPVRKLHVGKFMLEVNSILQRHNLIVPRDLALMIKALVTAEGTALTLFADLDVIKEAEPYAKKLALERWKPQELWRRMRRRIHHLVALQNKLPRQITTILEKIEHGDLQIPLQHKNLEDLQGTLERVANRMTVGLIIAAMIIGSSLIITTGVRPLLFGYSALGIIGYSFSGLLGIWLVFSIMRNKKL